MNLSMMYFPNPTLLFFIVFLSLFLPPPSILPLGISLGFFFPLAF